MPDINKYINREERKIDVDGFLNDTATELESKGVPDSKRYAYAIVVLKVNYAIHEYKWLNDLALILALKGYVNTIEELKEYDI